jgi:signal transduction histidine kinase
LVRLSLGMRVLLLLVAINGAVVALTFGYAARKISPLLAAELVQTVSNTIQPGGGANVARILEWPDWSQFDDALLVDRNLQVNSTGEVAPRGVALNPIGSQRRPADFDQQRVYAAILEAIQEKRAVEGVEGGRAVPILRGGNAWGGCWYRLGTLPFAKALLLDYFLPVFVLSTVLLSAGTFFALRRFVLDPVRELARGARRVAAGDLSVRISEPPSRDELSELVRSFNAMTEQVETFNARLADEVRRATEQARRAEAAAMTQRRLAAMGELAAGIAHEINNPLGGLLNAVETLSRGPQTPEKQRQYLALLGSGLERIRLTVGQLLRFTPRQTRKVPLDWIGPVEDAIALVRHRAARQEVEIQLLAQPGLLVQGQPHELGQGVLNLLVNALDALEHAAPGSGRIEVRLERVEARIAGEPGAVRLEVRDNGPGVAEEELGRIADLFYTTKEPGKGTGLGLSIVHQVVASHGGSVEFASRPGAGFCARITLPAFQREGEAAGPEVRA